MIFTFVGLSLLWLAGLQICRLCAASADYKTNCWMQAGAGFFIATALLILWLSNVPAPLNMASWGAVFISTLVALPLCCTFIRSKSIGLGDFNLAWLRAHLAHILIITLISAHLALVLTNNLSRDIYPWDAFTTWMYRAKVWVLNNQLLDFQTVNQWLQSGGEGYALRAASYPASVSAIAAFASALSGGWTDQAASLPWFFVTLATASLMYGLCRQSGLGTLPSLTGTYGLISIPLVSLHGVLAGYADLWMLGTSGMGLAALLLWAARPSKGLLCVSAALLLIGCFIKTEGWIWLGLGLLFISFLLLWKRYQFGALVGFMAVMLLFISLQSIDLGPLGLWGVHEGGMHIGPLGSYRLRSYNALPDYFEMIFMQGNFHLLGLFYLAALAVLTLRNPRRSATHWLMGGLIIASQGIIFGLSSYSLYAETGTSINRLLLHFLPVFVLTIVAGVQSLREICFLNKQTCVSDTKPLFNRTIVTSLIVVAGVAAAFLVDRSASSDGSPGHFFYASEDLVPVLGNLRLANNGRQQFTDAPRPMAVARVRLKNSGAAQARYVVTDVHITQPAAVSFYWITANNPQVQTYALDVSGPNILDMKSIATYWKRPIIEMGYLVDKQSLDDVQLGDLRVTGTLLPEALLAVLNHWATPDVISQRSINTVDGHLPSSVSWGGWQSMTLVLAVLLSLLVGVVAKSMAPHAAASCIALAALLWLVGDVISLRQLTAATPRFAEGKMNTGRQTNSGTGAALSEVADAISSNGNAEAGVISIALEPNWEFQAQKLPLLLAPRGAVRLRLSTATRRTKNWQGHFVVFSDNQITLEEATEKLVSGTNARLIERGENYVILGPTSS